MADLGAIASVIGVAGVGFRLSLVLNAISCEVTNAPIQIHHISKTVTLYSIILKQTGNVFQSPDSVHSHEAVQAAQQVANESTRVFDEINDMLERVQMKAVDGAVQPSVHQRFKWCFKKNRINYLLAQLDSLKLSLSLMLQVMQVGKLMSLTSKTDSPEQVSQNKAAIRQERAEAQNIVIIRYTQLKEVERLFQVAENGEDDLDALSPTSESSRLTIEPPPEEYLPSTALVRLPLHSLGEVDQILSTVRDSSKEMVRVSDQAIDPLLKKWTRWHDAREERHRQADARLIPQVDSLHDDDEDAPFHRRYPDHDNTHRGFYIEGVTTDWRRPHSVEARREAAARRKKYAEYQPSVSTASTDLEDSAGKNGPHPHRRTKRHIINSSSESSGSETEKSPRRRDSGVSSHGSRPITQLPRSQSATPKAIPAGSPPQTNGNRSLPSSYQAQFQSHPLPPPQQPLQPLQSPMQYRPPFLHHGVSSPLPPIHTSNVPNPYAARLRPPDRGPPNRSSGRPVSRDGPHGRSPSRPSYDTSPTDYKRSRDTRDEKRRSKEKQRNLRDGAAKGLIGAGAIAGFLEALEGLSL